jgi:hypothetical protein
VCSRRKLSVRKSSLFNILNIVQKKVKLNYKHPPQLKAGCAFGNVALSGRNDAPPYFNGIKGGGNFAEFVGRKDGKI